MSGLVPWKQVMVCEKCIRLDGKNADGTAATLFTRAQTKSVGIEECGVSSEYIRCN